MTPIKFSICSFLTLVLTLAGCAAQRTSPPPAGDALRLPWGAVSVDYTDAGSEIFTDQAVKEASASFEAFQRDHPGEKMPYRILALSGGGSRGAYGAGVLSGWTAKGSRPEFDAVTGISTGALQATAAFLGPEYDHMLKAATSISNKDIFVKNGTTAIFTKESLYDTTPLKAMLAEMLDEKTINAVAAEHNRGRRLFIGTTNLDANAFTIWDMGKIAASERPDRLQTYRDVVLASASYPLAFPPVYFPVTTEQGGTYYQMHVDGGVKESVFVFAYLAEMEQQLTRMGLDWDEDIQPEIVILNNGKLFTDHTYKPVKADSISIALASMEGLARKNVASSVYYIWSAGLASGASIDLSFIPLSYDLSNLAVLEFDPGEMKRLFQFGYDRALNGEAWLNREPAHNLKELEELIDIYNLIEPTIPGAVEDDLLNLPSGEE